MIFYCDRTDCPHCRTITTTRIDCRNRMPATVHVCSCTYRAEQGGCCLRCKYAERCEL